MPTRPLLALAAVALAGCGDPASVRADPSATPTGQRYQITATVLQSPSSGPQLCAGAVAYSRPPKCGGPPVEPWDWANVPGRDSASGTTWADVHLVGTFDGTTFHVTEPPSAPVRPSAASELDFPTTCAPPAGGWRHATRGDQDAAIAYGNNQPDVAGVWLSRPGDGVEVVNLAFTGDLDRHEREAKERWNGPLCVTRRAPARAELLRIQDEVAAAAKGDVPFVLLGDGVSDVRNVLDVTVLLADDAARAWFEQRYGTGLVELTGALQPI